MNKEINLGNLIIPVIKPQKGKDYYTESEKQELISIVTDNVNAGVLPQEQTRQSNEIIRQNNEQTRQAQETIRQTNETNRQTAETERESAENTRQSNESSRVSAEQTRTQTFNNKMDAVDTAIAGIHTSQNAYDQNATAKTSAFNENATSKTSDYNTNATNKTAEYNENASTKIAEYDAHIRDYEAELATKVDKVIGKGLSSNDFTNEEKAKLAELHNYDDTELSERVDDIEQEQTTQNTNISTNATNIETLQEENENLKKIVSQLPQVTGQGTEVTLENTIEAQFTKFDVEGNSTQDGTPSPDNEVPIESAGDNENLVNESNINFIYSSVNKVIYDNGLIKTINSPNGQFYEFDEPLESGETYTLTFKFVQGRVNVQGSQDFSIGMYHSGNNNSWQGNLTKTQIANIDLAGKTFTLTHKATDTITGLYIFIYSSPTFVTPLWFNVKLEKGNKASGYSPYGMGSINEKIKNADRTEEQDYSIFVRQPMRSIRDVRDCFVKENGTWFERHYIGQVVLDGNSTINNFYPNSGRCDISISNALLRGLCLCNYYQYKFAEENNKCFISGATSAFCFINTDIKSIEEVRAWLNEKQPEVIYQLATPLDLPCTQSQIEVLENKPSTYKDFTIIQSEDETEAYLEVSGIRDINTMFDKVTNAIVSLGGNV